MAHRNMADAIVAAGGIMRKIGLGGLPIEHGLAIDCSESVRDEHGFDAHGKPTLDNLMQRATDLILGLAAATDPNQRAQGVTYSKEAHLGQPIHLGNHLDWVARNRPPFNEMTTTNMAGALIELLKAAAVELGVPELTRLIQYADHKPTAKEPSKRILLPRHEIVLPRPYMMTLPTDGDPDDFDQVEALLRAMSVTAVRVNLVYISNQIAGLAPLRKLVQITGRYTDNVNLVDLSCYDGGLRGVDDEEFIPLLVAGLPEWCDEVTSDRQLLKVA